MTGKPHRFALLLVAVSLAAIAAPLLVGRLVGGFPEADGRTSNRAVANGPVTSAASTRFASSNLPSADRARAADPVAAAKAWLDANPGLAAGHRAGDFELESVSAGALPGQSLVRLRQHAAGVPVIAGEAVVLVSGEGAAKAANVEASRIGSKQGQAKLNAGAAANAAIAATAERTGAPRGGLSTSRPVLSIYDPALLGDPRGGAPTLVWRMTVRADSAEGPIRRDVFVDAADGSIVNSIQAVAAALNRRVCDANSSSADVPCLSPVRTEGAPATGITDADRAYDYAGDTWNLFKSVGRDSLDGNGMAILSTVRYCARDSAGVYRCPYPNAFWDGDQMVYGAGYSRADDVVAHELTHGVTDYSSALFYYFQSGAINEGISDVFGEFVDLVNGKGNDTEAVRWDIGEDLSGGAIRDMANPPAKGDPDRTGSSLYDADPNLTDDGGVHGNSGIVNKTAFLITDGGTFNGQTVTGVGLTKAIPIWYQASQLLTSGSDFRDLGDVLKQSCESLLGTSGIVADDCTQVAKATLATQLGTVPTKAPTVQAPVCTSGTPVDAWTESFEAGPGTLNGWSRTASVGSNRWYWASERPSDARYSRQGRQNLWGNSDSSRGDTTIAMTTSVTVPAGGLMRFEHSYDFEVTDGLTADGGVLEYSTNSGVSWDDAGSLMTEGGYSGRIYGEPDATNPLAGRLAFTGNSRGYSSTRLDLGALEGRTVRFRFRLATDDGNAGMLYGGWHIDRMRLYSCGGTAATVGQFSLSSPTAKGQLTPSRAEVASWSVTFSETVSGLTKDDFTVGGTSTGWAVSTVSGSGAGPYTVSLSGPESSDGTVTLTLRTGTVKSGSDVVSPASATTSTHQLRVDRTPPTTGLVAQPAAWLRSTSASFRFTGSDTGGSGVAGYECTLGAFGAGPMDPRLAGDACTNPKTFSGLTQGPHTMLARAVDAAGNVDLTPAVSTFAVDTVAPGTTIISGPTAGTRPTFGFSSSSLDASRFQCRFDSGSWVSCSSPYRRATALSRGYHTFSVRAVDRAGNADASPASKRLRVV